MKLNNKGLETKTAWEKAGVALPPYDPAALAERTKKDPVWVHFGIGNIFRIFIGGIADTLIREGLMDRGITCVETYDYEVADKIYRPFDNLVLAVTLHGDGRTDKKVLGSLTEAVKANSSMEEEWMRLKEVFANPGLQLVSFTITEKGYALRNPEGEYFPFVKDDIALGPEHVLGAMGVVTAMLYERFKAGGAPLSLVSMDNVSRNGEKLRESVLEIAGAWRERSFVEDAFLRYLKDENCVAFPWTMIDKITPRPSERVCEMLESSGIEDMNIIVTSKHTYIAPFVNAEEPQYLVVEDSFPNGRPPLERAGVYLTDRETVNQSERMKVTVCLNPIHTALCTYDCMLGYTYFAAGMKDPDLLELAGQVGYKEGLPVVEDPGILSPKAFLDELMLVRFPNDYLGDTSARIAVDISQMVAIRFGETIKAYVRNDGDAGKLVAIPLAIAGWIRYLLGVDDEGQPMELSPDPMIPYLKEQISGLVYGRPESLTNQLKDLLSNESIFGADLYRAGIGDKIEEMVRRQMEGPGAVRRTLQEYLYKNR